jgi:hypothetical protein
MSSRACMTALVHTSLRASEGVVTRDLENIGVLVNTFRISCRLRNLSFPPQRNTVKGASRASVTTPLILDEVLS